MSSMSYSTASAWRQVRAALALEPADLVVRNCQIVNVYSGEIHRGDIAVQADAIVAIREAYAGEAKETVDAAGAFAVPAFLDGSGPDLPICPTGDSVVAELRRGRHAFLAVDPTAIEILAGLKSKGIDLSRVCLVSDGPSPAWGPLLENGIGIGIAPPELFAMASLNLSILYGNDHLRGSIAPGRQADFFLVRRFNPFVPYAFVKGGRLVGTHPASSGPA